MIANVLLESDRLEGLLAPKVHRSLDQYNTYFSHPKLILKRSLYVTLGITKKYGNIVRA